MRERLHGREDFTNVDHASLIDRFYETNGDPAIGRELSRRLLQHAGFTGRATSLPLLDKSGQQIRDEVSRRWLTLDDYVSYATVHHPYAVEEILNFLLTEPGHADYDAGRATILARTGSDRA